MFMLIFATCLLLYEVYKLLYMNKQMAVMRDMETISSSKNPSEVRLTKEKYSGDIRYAITILIEALYFVFILIALFTRAWPVSVGLIICMVLRHLIGPHLNDKLVWSMDCILSIATLGVVYIIYL